MKNAKRILALVLTLCLVIPMALVTVGAEAQTYHVDLDADLETLIAEYCSDNPWSKYDESKGKYSSVTVLGTHKNGATCGNYAKYFQPLYEGGHIDYLPVSGDGTVAMAYGSPSSGVADPWFLRVTAKNGAGVGCWYALKIRMPAAGSYNVAIEQYYANTNNAIDIALYMIPADAAATATGSGSAAASKAAVSEWMTDAYKLGVASFAAEGIDTKTYPSVNVAKDGEDVTVNVTEEEYIFVFEITGANNDNGNTYMWLTGLDFTPVAGGSTEPEATEPEATEPEATKPQPTEPEATEPQPTEPEATEPQPTEPEATEPQPTEPEATEPQPTEPEEPTLPAPVAGADYDLFHDSLKDLDYTSESAAKLTEELYAAMNELYLKGEMLAVPLAHSASGNQGIVCNGKSGKNFTYDGFKAQKGKVNDWYAFKFRVIDGGDYTIGADVYWLNANNNAVFDAYLLPADTADIAAALTAENKLGEIDMGGTLLGNATYSITVAKKQALEANSEYILVLKVVEDLNKPDSNRVDLMIPGLNIEKYQANTESIKYGDGNFSFADAGLTNFNKNDMADISVGPNYAALVDRYNINGWKPVGDNSETAYISLYNGTATNGTVALSGRGLVAGDWLAFQFKNPGTGSFDVSFDLYRNSYTKANVSIYIIPASTTDIDAALTSANLYYSGNTYTKADTGVDGTAGYTVQATKKLTSTADSGDYIMVLKVDEVTNGASEARIFLTGFEIAGMSVSDTIPSTGDNAPVMLLGFIALISLAAVCVVSKKRIAC